MTRVKLIWILPLVTLFLPGCSKKNEGVGLSNNAAALTVVNLINGSNGIYTNFTPNYGGKNVTDTLMWYSTAAEVGYGAFEEFSLQSGFEDLGIASVTDTSTVEWAGAFSFQTATIHSLYFIGPDTSHIDTLLTTDFPPNFGLGDSVVGVRFVELAPNADPVEVDIQNGSDTLAKSLGYKGVTQFFALPATTANPASQQYTFEFRDMVTGNVLATYNYAYFYWFKSITIVLSNGGSVGVWNASEVNNF
jgi:hypothetical protein